MRERKSVSAENWVWKSNRTVEGFGVIDAVLDGVWRFEFHRLVLHARFWCRNHPARNGVQALGFSLQQTFVQSSLLKDCRHRTFRFRSVLDWLLVKRWRLIYGGCMLFHLLAGIADGSSGFWERKKLFSFNYCDWTIRWWRLPGSFNPLHRWLVNWRFWFGKLMVHVVEVKATAGTRKLQKFREIGNFATEHFEGRTKIEWKLVLKSFRGCCGGKILSRQPQVTFMVASVEK